MAWCCQATSHCLSQFRSRSSMSPYSVTGPLCVNGTFSWASTTVAVHLASDWRQQIYKCFHEVDWSPKSVQACWHWRICSWSNTTAIIHDLSDSIPQVCESESIIHPGPSYNQIYVDFHYNDVIMSTMAPRVTSLTIVYSTVYSGVDQRKLQNSASLAFVRGIHRWPVNSPHIGPVTRKMFPFDDVIMVRSITVHEEPVTHEAFSYHDGFIILSNSLLPWWMKREMGYYQRTTATLSVALHVMPANMKSKPIF